MIIPKLKAPIVLVHGLFGVNHIRLGSMMLFQYFAGIPEFMSRSGNRVLVPCLSPVGSVEERAQQLKDFLDREVPGDGVHILAHSMGGLDARYMISRLGMGKRVASLTTLGTPHRGTSFADWGVRRLSIFVQPILDMLGIPTQAFHDLTREKCRKFNESVPDVPGVRYFSVAANHDGNGPEWTLPYGIVYKEEGPNDGVVSVESARHGHVIDVWDGDHFSLINWSGPFKQSRGTELTVDHRYGPLLRRLADEGL